MSTDIQRPAGNAADSSGHLTAGLTRWGTIGVVAGTMLALLLAALDQTIVGTAMPRIVAELNGLNYYSWVITAYLVASTIMVPIAGKLGDLFGRKPFLLAGMIGFVAASALCGQSHSMLELVTFRTIQGIFGGMLFATVFAVIGDLFPPSQRARLAGLFGAVFGLSSIVGPTAGGYITDSWGWRWVFYVNLPVGIIAVLLVIATMPYVRSSASLRDIDFLGAGMLIAGLVPLMVALSITRDHGWTSPEVLGLLGVAAVLLIAFFVVETRTDHPIVPFGLFKNSTFSVSMIVGFLTGFGMFGTIVFVPLIYQGVLGVSATNSGQLLTPMMLGLIVASTLVGQAMVRIRYYRFLGTGGIVVMLVGMWLLSQVTVTTSRFEVVRDIVLVGAGLGTTFPLYLTAVQTALPRNFLGVASSQIQFWRQIGGTIGTAVLGSVLAQRLPVHVQEQVASLHLPSQIASRFVSAGGSNPQTLFDPAQIAARRAQAGALGPQGAAIFDQVLHAIRAGLATTLHEIFLYGAAVLILALIASVFLNDVPLRGRLPAQEEGAPVAAA
ncbi:MAG TPA: DHA2 family efflux MFS transporter permease subunit [Candidatus Dormibacteraeota bacterium]|nr:DHA2 family efflux MFS transporter permease subunit [Candidatus Dormibacteraeota bacterium]